MATDRRRRAGGQIHGGTFNGPVLNSGTQINHHYHRSGRVYTVVGVIAALAAVVVPVAFLGHHLYVSSPAQRRAEEQRRVERLVPGETYEHLRATFGASPDYSFKLPTGNVIHQFEREWETVQVLENPSGMVLSVGLYAKDSRFRPVVALGGVRIELNSATPANAVPGFPPVAAIGYCGAHKAGYLEAHYPLPNAMGARNVVVGAGNAETDRISVTALCGDLGASGCQSADFRDGSEISPDYAACLLGTESGRRLRDTQPISVIVHTAPGGAVIPDMLHPPDVVAAGAVNFP